MKELVDYSSHGPDTKHFKDLRNQATLAIKLHEENLILENRIKSSNYKLTVAYKENAALRAELATAQQEATAYRINLENLEKELIESGDIQARANLRYMEKCKELDLLKQSISKIKADAVLDYAKNMESIEQAANLKMEQGLRMMASFAKKTAEEYASTLEAGETDDCECAELGSICGHCEKEE